MRRTTMHFGQQEIRELFLAAGLLTLAFTILELGLRLGLGWILVFIQLFFVVGISFILHELAHKYFALRYGCSAEFKANKMMLGLAVLMSFFGFIFAAPGAVHIRGRLGKYQHLHIAAAGPGVNIVLSLLFLVMSLTFGSGILYYGFFVNAYLALFNLLPIRGFDGYVVWNTDKRWAIPLLAVSGILLLIAYL